MLSLLAQTAFGPPYHSRPNGSVSEIRSTVAMIYVGRSRTTPAVRVSEGEEPTASGTFSKRGRVDRQL